MSETEDLIQKLEKLQQALESGKFSVGKEALDVLAEDEVVRASTESGIVLHFYRISMAAHLLEPSPVNAVKGYIQERIDQILSVMPAGTKFISADQMGIDDLTIPYIFKFHHPLFKSGTKIELNFHRDVWTTEDLVDGKLTHNCNVLTGIRYTNPDGTQKYQGV